MKIKDLDKLLKLLNKFKEEPDYEEFDEDLLADEMIHIVEVYKDFLGDDDNGIMDKNSR